MEAPKRTSGTYAKPRYYAEAAVRQGSTYFDYEDMHIQYGYRLLLHSNYRNIDEYELVRKLGRGKYSEVYEGVDSNRQPVAIKILKPGTTITLNPNNNVSAVRTSKYFRQIKILQNLRGGPGIINLQNIVKDSISGTTSLIMEFVKASDPKVLYPTLKPKQVKEYMRQLLKCLDFCHSKGIMHRDVKPQNVLIDHANKTLRLADWGLADFYFPAKQYNVRVASRYYKGPELLVNYMYYDYSLDMWSLGVMFASIIFKKQPFFMGTDNYDQLDKIARVLGSEGLNAYVKKYGAKPDSGCSHVLSAKYPARAWEDFVNQNNKDLATPEAIDLVKQLVKYDHAERWLPQEALNHPYFQE